MSLAHADWLLITLLTGGLVFFAALHCDGLQQRAFQATEAHLASTLSAAPSGLAQVTGSCHCKMMLPILKK